MYTSHDSKSFLEPSFQLNNHSLPSPYLTVYPIVDVDSRNSQEPEGEESLQANDSGYICAICQDTESNVRYCETGCGHTYHTDCLGKILRRSDNTLCPLCRIRLDCTSLSYLPMIQLLNRFNQTPPERTHLLALIVDTLSQTNNDDINTALTPLINIFIDRIRTFHQNNSQLEGLSLLEISVAIVQLNRSNHQGTDTIILRQLNENISQLQVEDSTPPRQHYFSQLVNDISRLSITRAENFSPDDMEILLEYTQHVTVLLMGNNRNDLNIYIHANRAMNIFIRLIKKLKEKEKEILKSLLHMLNLAVQEDTQTSEDFITASFLQNMIQLDVSMGTPATIINDNLSLYNLALTPIVEYNRFQDLGLSREELQCFIRFIGSLNRPPYNTNIPTIKKHLETLYLRHYKKLRGMILKFKRLFS